MSQHHEHSGQSQTVTVRDLNQLAVSATVHCLTGCAIGEVLGLVLATWWGWSDAPSIALAVALAFFFGYSLTIWPLLRSAVPFRAAIGVALAADTVSILVMELVDNAVILAVPGAMEAGLDDILFWGTLVFSLAVAFVVTLPVNRALIRRGKGHAVVHSYHHSRELWNDGSRASPDRAALSGRATSKKRYSSCEEARKTAPQQARSRERT
jgi:hypothetical protein